MCSIIITAQYIFTTILHRKIAVGHVYFLGFSNFSTLKIIDLWVENLLAFVPFVYINDPCVLLLFVSDHWSETLSAPHWSGFKWTIFHRCTLLKCLWNRVKASNVNGKNVCVKALHTYERVHTWYYFECVRSSETLLLSLPDVSAKQAGWHENRTICVSDPTAKQPVTRSSCLGTAETIPRCSPWMTPGIQEDGGWRRRVYLSQLHLTDGPEASSTYGKDRTAGFSRVLLTALVQTEMSWNMSWPFALCSKTKTVFLMQISVHKATILPLTNCLIHTHQ